VGIERDWEMRTTNIRLQNLDRFSFDAQSAPAAVPSPFVQDVETHQSDDGNLNRTGVAGDSVRRGDVVYQDTNGKLYRAVAENSCFGCLVGIASSDAEADESLVILTSGVAQADAYALSPGQPVYLRSTALGTPNVSSSRLTSNTGTENLFAPVGVALTATSFKIEFDMQFYFPPVII
jgi:hypothetical protein